MIESEIEQEEIEKREDLRRRGQRKSLILFIYFSVTGSGAYPLGPPERGAGMPVGVSHRSRRDD